MQFALVPSPTLLDRLLRHGTHRLARRLPFRPLRLQLARPVVSFSFDDFPAATARNAAPLLEDAGMTGTFYFADALADTVQNGLRLASADIAADLARRGHEIGARADLTIIDANIAAIKSLPGGTRPTSFACPDDGVSLRARLGLLQRFDGLRSTRIGINHGRIDLAQLKSHELCDRSSTTGTIATLLSELERTSGWLIFHTHDVRRDPSARGCSPWYFAQVLELVRARGLAVKTVGQMLAALVNR